VGAYKFLLNHLDLFMDFDKLANYEDARIFHTSNQAFASYKLILTNKNMFITNPE
jgi:hypothetical protein